MHDCGEGRERHGLHPGAPSTRRLVMVGQNPPCYLYIQGSGVGVCGELSNQVQGLFKIHLIRCPPLQTFARAVLLLWRPVLFQKPVLDQGKNLRVIELALAVVTCPCLACAASIAVAVAFERARDGELAPPRRGDNGGDAPAPGSLNHYVYSRSVGARWIQALICALLQGFEVSAVSLVSVFFVAVAPGL